MKGLLNQVSNAAVKTKGSIFEFIYRRLVPRLGHAQAIGAIAHRLCRLIWIILHRAIRYEERGPAFQTDERSNSLRVSRQARGLGRLLRGGVEYMRSRTVFTSRYGSKQDFRHSAGNGYFPPLRQSISNVIQRWEVIPGGLGAIGEREHKTLRQSDICCHTIGCEKRF